MRHRTSSLVGCVAVLTFALICALPTLAPAATYTLRLGHDMPAEHPYNKTALHFAEEVKKATNGDVEVKVFPAAALGDELTMLDSVRLGDLDFSLAAAGNAASFVPGLGIYSVGYLFQNQKHFLNAVRDAELNRMTSELIGKRNAGFNYLTMFCAGTRSLYNRLKPITKVEDIRGLKLRVMASPIESRVWKALGALPTSIPYGEVYTSVQTGVVDAAENGPTSYYFVKHHEVAPYFSLSEHQFLVSVLVRSDKTWARLPENIRTTIARLAPEVGVFGTQAFFDGEAKVLGEEFKKAGVKVNPVDKKGFVEKIGPLQGEVAKELGVTNILARVRALNQ
jgi:tripartite ATP-independent transporter DctP family solute receptor